MPLLPPRGGVYSSIFSIWAVLNLALTNRMFCESSRTWASRRLEVSAFALLEHCPTIVQGSSPDLLEKRGYVVRELGSSGQHQSARECGCLGHSSSPSTNRTMKNLNHYSVKPPNLGWFNIWQWRIRQSLRETFRQMSLVLIFISEIQKTSQLFPTSSLQGRCAFHN